MRSVQNWIGGSDFTPLNATYTPPPPELVEALMADALAFANRTDIGAVAQAAILHAQFESIHPYTDGNGRIGRARHPVATSSIAIEQLHVSRRSALTALERLAASGILTEVGGKKERVWMADEVIDELDDLDDRIGYRVTPSNT